LQIAFRRRRRHDCHAPPLRDTPTADRYFFAIDFLKPFSSRPFSRRFDFRRHFSRCNIFEFQARRDSHTPLIRDTTDVIFIISSLPVYCFRLFFVISIFDYCHCADDLAFFAAARCRRELSLAATCRRR